MRIRLVITIVLSTITLALLPVHAQDSVPECLDSAWNVLRNSAPSPKKGYVLHRSYTVTRIAQRRDGYDTSRVRYDIRVTEAQFHLVTDQMEIHTDDSTSVVILPGQKVIALTSVIGDRKIPEKWTADIHPVGDSLLAWARNVRCRDSTLADGLTHRVVSFDLAEEHQSTATARGMTIILGDRSFPDRIVTTYTPYSEFTRSEIEIHTVEYLPEPSEYHRPVLSMFEGDSAELRARYQGYRVIDDR